MIRRTVRIVALALPILIVGACEDAFEPFKAADQHFSIFGYLDATADTQWIRVTPIRQSVFTSPGKLDVTVTLEDTGTGATTALHDSIFRYQATANVAGAAASWVHNYWTDVPIRFGATYRLSVMAADGVTATALASVPGELPEIVIETRVVTSGRTTAERYFLRVRVEHMPLVQVIHYVAGRTPADLAGTFTNCPFAPEIPRVYPIRQTVPQAVTVGAPTEIEISKTLNSRFLETGTSPASCVVNRREVLIASPGFEWPTGAQYSASAPALGAVPSTIAGGVGFVGGLVTRTAPFENCAVRPVAAGNSCVLRYNDQSATVAGVVLDSRCGWPVEGATVELSTLGAGPTLVRTTTTDELGRYRIGALVGGTSYAVLVSQPLRWPPGDPYAVQRAYLDLRDTVTAQAGKTRTYDLTLPRQVACVFTP
ncbi:MAG: hypothetical protein FIB00_05755 [Chloroflexi bacterium]|nr:hypothetical protein [Chloroflexota bacterium]